MGAEVEIKGVELAEIRAGISLLAGHRVVLVVNGVRGSRRYTRGDTSGGDGSGDDLEIVSEAGQRPVSQPAKSGSRALSLVLQDDEGTPRANLKFTLRAGSGSDVCHCRQHSARPDGALGTSNMSDVLRPNLTTRCAERSYLMGRRQRRLEPLPRDPRPTLRCDNGSGKAVC